MDSAPAEMAPKCPVQPVGDGRAQTPPPAVVDEGRQRRPDVPRPQAGSPGADRGDVLGGFRNGWPAGGVRMMYPHRRRPPRRSCFVRAPRPQCRHRDVVGTDVLQHVGVQRGTRTMVRHARCRGPVGGWSDGGGGAPPRCRVRSCARRAPVTAAWGAGPGRHRPYNRVRHRVVSCAGADGPVGCLSADRGRGRVPWWRHLPGPIGARRRGGPAGPGLTSGGGERAGPGRQPCAAGGPRSRPRGAVRPAAGRSRGRSCHRTGKRQEGGGCPWPPGGRGPGLGRGYGQDAVFAWTPTEWAIVACGGGRRLVSSWSLVDLAARFCFSRTSVKPI